MLNPCHFFETIQYYLKHYKPISSTFYVNLLMQNKSPLSSDKYIFLFTSV